MSAPHEGKFLVTSDGNAFMVNSLELLEEEILTPMGGTTAKIRNVRATYLGKLHPNILKSLRDSEHIMRITEQDEESIAREARKRQLEYYTQNVTAIIEKESILEEVANVIETFEPEDEDEQRYFTVLANLFDKAKELKT